MFEYLICNRTDEFVFDKQCKALEKSIPSIVKKQLLNDVDDSQTQLYTIDDKLITVHNSTYLDSVFIKSEIDINPYF